MKYSVSEPVIIGGMVLDINATPSTPVFPRTTTPGKVRYVLGGVARNTAECILKLGLKPYLISAVGLDVAGNLLLEHWRSSGLDIEGIQKVQEANTSVVCNIFDVNGELAAAVASFEAIENFLTSEWVQKFECNILTAPLLMVDANLNHSALEACCHIAARSDIPLWFEPVSVAKSRRIASVAKYITFASPNEDELMAMANSLSCGDVFNPIQRSSGKRGPVMSLFRMLKPAIWVLLEKGIKIVLVTLGSDGVFLCSKGGGSDSCLMMNPCPNRIRHGGGADLYRAATSRMSLDERLLGHCRGRCGGFLAVHFPALPAPVGGLTGCGDCFAGGALASMAAGLDVFRSVAVGVAAAKGAVGSDDNVPSEFCLSKLADDAWKVFDAAMVLTNRSML